MEFGVHFLKVKQHHSKELLKELKANCTYSKLKDIWIFEGDFRTTLLPWEGEYECLGYGIVGPLGGLSQKALANEIEETMMPGEMEW